jgi:hypothetical protein
MRRGIGEYRPAEPAQANGSSYSTGGLPPATPPVTGAPPASAATPPAGTPLASGQPLQPAQPSQAPAADREPAVVHEPVQRFVELPPEPRPSRPAPRPIVVDDDLDVPDFLK